jgi:hypothetical protein
VQESPAFTEAAEYRYLIKEEIERSKSGKENEVGYTATQDVGKLAPEEAGHEDMRANPPHAKEITNRGGVRRGGAVCVCVCVKSTNLTTELSPERCISWRTAKVWVVPEKI